MKTQPAPHVAVTRLATLDDIPAILAISNHYALATHANFAVEPESLESWQETWRATNEKHPWLVAEQRHQGIEASRDHVSEATASAAPPSMPGCLGPSAPSSAILGFAKSSPWKGRCAYLWTAETSVYLKPEHFGKGAGRALYTRMIEVMRAQGWRTLLGGITQPNEASVRLHEACGFRKVAHLERVGWKFNQWWDVGYWELHLREGTAPPGSIRSVREVVDR